MKRQLLLLILLLLAAGGGNTLAGGSGDLGAAGGELERATETDQRCWSPSCEP